MTSEIDELRRLLDERDVEYDESTHGNTTLFQFDYCDNCGDYMHAIAITGECISVNSDYLTPEQAIAATLGSQIDADLRKAIDFMRIWIAEDAHLGESAISRELEKAEGLRKLDAIENAIAATLGNGTCEDLGGTGGYTCSQFACSECGCTIDITDYQYNEPTMYTADGIADVPHFCPGCGKAVKR